MLITPGGDLTAASAGSLPQLVTGQAERGLGDAAIFPPSRAVPIAPTRRTDGRPRTPSPRAVSVAFGDAGPA
jgi:hypothetical protein